jgi:phosphoglycolate phosphatase
MSFQAVIFDLDGTLLDTLADIAHSMNHALALNGYPRHPVDSYRDRVGWGIRVLAEKSLPADQLTSESIERCINDMKQYYGQHPADHTILFDGIGDLLTDLTRAGVFLSVVSNKPHALVVQVVDQVLADWSFVSVYGDRPDFAMKPNPQTALAAAREMGVQPAQVLFVGDSDIDIATAIAAGMYPVGVTWGFRTSGELRAAGAREVIDHPRELIELIGRLNDSPATLFSDSGANRRAK